jgi:predicted metal-dependent phosphoesterase TrpH
VRIDLHTHSNVSDGTEPPRELVRLAAAAKLDVVAITDHDTVAGWAEAAAAAPEFGITVVPGLELSCTRGAASVHVLGYRIDPGRPGVAEELAAIRAGRTDRLPAMLAALARHGVDLSSEQVWAAAGGADSLGRPHVADALIAAGYVADRGEAFDVWLAEGRPAHIARYAPDVVDGIRLIRAAGGVAVIAHPWGRESRDTVTPEVLAEFAAAGLAGIEAHHDDHDEPTELALVALAADLGIVVTGGSDWHGAGKIGHGLGSRLTEPAAYEDLLSRIPAAG